jgi:hypothetical protein
LLLSSLQDEVLQLSESLLFIFRNEPGDAFLAAVSKFILNAYEFGDATSPDATPAATASPDARDDLVSIESKGAAAVGRSRASSTVSTPGHHSRPYLSLATFRMVILADELLEGFFERDLSASFQLEPVGNYSNKAAEVAKSGLWGGFKNLVLTNENLTTFNRVRRSAPVSLLFLRPFADALLLLSPIAGRRRRRPARPARGQSARLASRQTPS